MPGKAERSDKTSVERRHFRFRPAYVLLVILLGLFAFQFLRKDQEVRALDQQAAALRYANQQTAADNARTARAIRWYHNPQYIEEAARAIFGYTMPGETAVISRPRHVRTLQVQAAPRVPATPPSPSWQEWWHAFFG